MDKKKSGMFVASNLSQECTEPQVLSMIDVDSLKLTANRPNCPHKEMDHLPKKNKIGAMLAVSFREAIYIYIYLYIHPQIFMNFLFV